MFITKDLTSPDATNLYIHISYKDFSLHKHDNIIKVYKHSGLASGLFLLVQIQIRVINFENGKDTDLGMHTWWVI